MYKKVGAGLIAISLASILVALWSILGMGYWIKPPHAKFLATWTEDLNNLKKLKKLPKGWDEIRELKISPDTTPNSQIQEWMAKVVPPIALNRKGRYKLEIDIFFQIDGNRYGTAMQYHLVDIATKNTVTEFGRTYQLGFFY